MSVRKRTWKTRKGARRSAWIVDTVAEGRRQLYTFATKAEANTYNMVLNPPPCDKNPTPSLIFTKLREGTFLTERDRKFLIRHLKKTGLHQ